MNNDLQQRSAAVEILRAVKLSVEAPLPADESARQWLYLFPVYLKAI